MKKRKILHELYESHKAKQLRDLAEKSSLKLNLLGSVRKRCNAIEDYGKNNTGTSDNALLDADTSNKNNSPISLVSGAYDSSSSDDPT